MMAHSLTDDLGEERPAVVTARAVSKEFRTGSMFNRQSFRAVDSVSFTIQARETVGLVGESGCGKTTLARMILLLDTPTDGDLCFDGKPYGAFSRWERKRFRREVQAVFQDPYTSLDPTQRISSVIGETVRQFPRSERRALMDEALAAVGLDARSVLDRYPHQFSGGQRQRIALARALAPRPRLIVLDEPTSSLDVSMRAQVLNLLLDIQRSHDTALLLISHDILSVRHLTDKCLVMYLGSVMETGPSEILIDEPLHPYTKVLVAAMTDSEMVAAAPEVIPSTDDEVPSAVRRPPGCPFNTRCPHAWKRCREDEPPLLQVSASRSVSCWLYDEPARPQGTIQSTERYHAAPALPAAQQQHYQ